MLDLSMCCRQGTTKKYQVTSLLILVYCKSVIYFDGIGSEEEPATVTIASSGQGLHFSTSQQGGGGGGSGAAFRGAHDLGREWESRGEAAGGGTHGCRVSREVSYIPAL